MKFKIDEKVNVRGLGAGVIYDYSHRYNNYTIKSGNKIIRGVDESRISKVD